MGWGGGRDRKGTSNPPTNINSRGPHLGSGKLLQNARDPLQRVPRLLLGSRQILKLDDFIVPFSRYEDRGQREANASRTLVARPQLFQTKEECAEIAWHFCTSPVRMPGVSILPPPPPAADLGLGSRKRPQQGPGKREKHARGRPGLTSAAQRVLAERAGRRPQQGQRGPGQRAGGGAARSHPGRTRPRLGPRAFHPPRHLWGQRCARGNDLGGGTWARLGVGACGGSPGSLDWRGSDSHNRGTGASRAGQGAIFSESCSPSWADRTS